MVPFNRYGQTTLATNEGAMRPFGVEAGTRSGVVAYRTDDNAWNRADKRQSPGLVAVRWLNGLILPRFLSRLRDQRVYISKCTLTGIENTIRTVTHETCVNIVD